jgi:sulfatase maturation enzyme AslB (radical SAM superfamily)
MKREIAENEIKNIVFDMLRKYKNTEGTYHNIITAVSAYIVYNDVFKRSYVQSKMRRMINKFYNLYYSAH